MQPLFAWHDLTLKRVTFRKESRVRTHTLSVGMRMYFLNAFERHLPIFWIWISENPNEAAVVAAPIRKLWNWYRCKSRLQKAKAVRKWCVKNCLESGNLSMKEKRGSEGDPCFLRWRYWVSAKQRQITGFLVFWC